MAAVCLLGGAGATVMRLQVRRAAALADRERAERAKLEGQAPVGRPAGGGRAAGRQRGPRLQQPAHRHQRVHGATGGEIGGANRPARAGKLATAIRRAGEQAAALTRQLLAFSRHGAVAPHPLDLNRVVRDAADLLERLIGDRAAVRLVAAPGLPPVVAEPGQLAQVLLNLAVNAADAMPGGGTFTLTTAAPEPGWVRLTAADTGTGMTDEAKARAFEAGFTTKPVGKGTGLGLATVYGIVRGFGGRVRFTSELGRGTAFEIDLPAAPGAAPAALPEHPTAEVTLDATRPAPALPPAPAVVLLVEDEEAVCALLRHVLEAAGHTVLAAGAPDAALQLLGQHPGRLDLLLTDVVLPGLSGRQLADRVRAARPDARVLFMSGYTAEEVREQGVSEEQVEFLHKPFLPRDLVERVARVLAPPEPPAHAK
jgi:CheY-like chemotaxis protein